MATLALQFAGQSLGSFLGGPLGSIAGKAIGGLAGQVLDQALLGRNGPARTVEGPRLKDLEVQHSSEGSPIPKLYGRARLSGQVIWATRFEEEIQTKTTKSRPKIGPSRVESKTVTYLYYANFAVGLCEGKISRIGRIWADGKLLDPAGVAYRVYTGTEDQLPDPLISAKEGGVNTPAYRGLAYVVFDRMPIERFGNRIPQLAFEVFRALDDLETRINAVTMIPGATEFGYHTSEIKQVLGPGAVAVENVHSGQGGTDWSVALNQLAASCPNVGSMALVVSWFGSDLRCGQCEIAPAVDNKTKQTDIEAWRVSDTFRVSANLVSQVEGRAAFGGTPSDSSVIAAIKDTRAREMNVVFYPFIMMDIPAGNAMGDPYTGAATQPPYPWRGQITCDPAPGRVGTPDKTSAATAQVDAFFGTAAVSDFSIVGNHIVYSGPAEWSFRRMILHYAHLCVLAGGVDTFLIGSELRNLIHIRDSGDHYPAVDHLISLAADVRQILGPGTKISYAADWSEYFGHHPQDGSGDVFFHLDPLWSDGNIDFVGIDNYMPMSDWRAGNGHLDKLAGHKSIYDLDYLRSNIANGEGYDWYYASASDRDNQVRTSITDGTYGKPWVFRYKDLQNWWRNPHYNRPGGVETVSPTGWVPESKQIWFTETGCPAADKGTNQPNVFLDPKSSSSFLPYYSSGVRDDLIQRHYLKALISYWTPSHPDYEAGSNPVSAVYGGRMVAHDALFIWTWDARPFPHFPQLTSVWADGPNWSRGHWINGRMGSAPLNLLVAAILEDYGFLDYVSDALYGIADGYVIDRAMSARQALEPLGLAYFFDAVESGDKVVFAHRDGDPVATIGEQDLVEVDDRALVSLTRAQETELPVAVQLSYMDSVADYRVAAVESRRLVGLSRRDARADLPIVLPFERVQQMADIWLQDLWAGREAGSFKLPPSLLAIEPGDNVQLIRSGVEQGLRVTEASLGAALAVEARSIEPGVYTPGLTASRNSEPEIGPVYGQPDLVLLNLPQLDGDGSKPNMRIAALADPWPGGLAVYQSRNGSSFDFLQMLEAPATMGRTLTALSSGPIGRWDRGSSLRVKLDNGTLSSRIADLILNGENIAAIGVDDGPWEIIQFADAVLVAEDIYDLSLLLRGQGGSEQAMADLLAVGARFVLLDGSVDPLEIGLEAIGQPVAMRAGPYQLDPGHASFAERVVTVGDAGLRPLSPVHVRARRDGDDIKISFVRRTRVDGDNWAPVEIPLGETQEHYEIDILDGGSVIRTLSTDTPNVTYGEADRVADGISLPGSLMLSVSQISETVGRGYPRTVTLQV